MTAVTTFTGQQRATAVLAAILALPGLPAATWLVHPDRLATDGSELSGQVAHGTPDDVRAAIDAYVTAFSELRYNDEKFVKGNPWSSFTSIGASGVIDGVHVRVWGAAR